MASVNKVILIGNLGRDPEVRYMPSGDAVANFSVATTEKWKDKSGEMQEQTEWHRVSFFGRQAEICGEYLRKGSSVYIEGRLQTRKWTDKDGNERTTTEIRGDRMQMLGGRGGGAGGTREMLDTESAPPPESAPAAKRPTAAAGANGAKKSTGFDDLDATWMGPDALMRRVEAAERLAERDGRRSDLPPAGSRADLRHQEPWRLGDAGAMIRPEKVIPR